MSIEYYVGTEGPTIVVNSVDDLHEALDTLHTQTIDNVKDNKPALEILEKAMSDLDDKYDL